MIAIVLAALASFNATGVVDPQCGHVQGMCTDGSTVYVSQATRLTKVDASGRVLAATNVVNHTGDVCLWDGKVFTAVAAREGVHKGKGVIQVFDTNLVFLTEQEFPNRLDGITCLKGKLYVGEAKAGGHAAHRGNSILRVDAKTLKAEFRREIDHGFATYHGVQNAATDGHRLYFCFYPADDKTVDTAVCTPDLLVLGFGRKKDLLRIPETYVPDGRLMDFVTEKFKYTSLHLQGISCDETGIYYGFANGVTKTDWSGKVLGQGISSYGSDGHIGDVCVHKGKVYATSWTQPKGKSYLERLGLIQIFDAKTMKPLPEENKVLPYPTDGIEFYEGAFWIGKPYRGPNPHTNMTIAVWNEDFTKELSTPVHATDGTKILYTMQTLAEMDGLLWHGCYVDWDAYKWKGLPVPTSQTFLTDRDGRIVCVSDVYAATGIATVPASLARGRKLVITARNEGNRVRVRFFEFRDNRLEPALMTAEELEAKNRALKAELKALESRAAELGNSCIRLEESVRVTKVASELMDGTRKEPPKPRLVEREIFAEGFDRPVFFDATKGKVKNREQWLTDKMKAGAKYRFDCEVRTEDLKGTDRVKFMGYMPVKGAPTEWPGVGATGSGSYGWTKLSFSFTLPHGGAFMLSYGSGEGLGKVWFRNVRGVEVREVEE